MNPPPRSVSLGVTLVVIASLCFGSISVLTVLATRHGVSLVTTMAWRYLIAALVMTVVVRPAALRGFSKGKILQILAIAGGGQALITFVSLTALNYIGVGPLAFLFYTYPAWVALIAAGTGMEKLGPTRLAALALAMTGVFVLVGVSEWKSLNHRGVFLALGAALLYSLYLPALSRFTRGINVRAVTLVLVWGATIAFVSAALVQGTITSPHLASAWIEILLLAILSTAIAFAFLIAGLGVLGAVRTSIISTVEPFFTALLGILVLHDSLQLRTILGGALVVAAVLLIELSSQHRARGPGPAGSAQLQSSDSEDRLG